MISSCQCLSWSGFLLCGLIKWSFMGRSPVGTLFMGWFLCGLINWSFMGMGFYYDITHGMGFVWSHQLVFHGGDFL